MEYNTDPKLYSPLTLAFLGDAVLELLVREKVTAMGSMPVGKLHKHAVSYVCASSQAEGITRILDMLTEEEEAVFRRGRNANSNHVPRNSNPKEYRTATGLEALFGYLHMNGQDRRIKEIFSCFWEAVHTYLSEQSE